MSNDIRFSGVAVYPHVVRADDAPTSPDIDALADTLLALDGVQQCDLAAALVRRDPRTADALSTTIGDAVAAGLEPPLGMVIGGPALSLDDDADWCGQCALPADVCRGHDEYRRQLAMAQ